MLADILPTGVFAALQAVNHPKVLPVVTGLPWPECLSGVNSTQGNVVGLTPKDRTLTLAIIGLGPVGICAAVSLLDVVATRKLPFRIVAIDPIESRREKMRAVYSAIDVSGKGSGVFEVHNIDDARDAVKSWTDDVGCTAVLEVHLLLQFF
jgi:threonine dehydrogenase-like Zn-dependent dehydrogenase